MYKEQIKNLLQPFSFFKNMSDEEMDAIVNISGTRKLAKILIFLCKMNRYRMFISFMMAK